jgi:hypothetical protein
MTLDMHRITRRLLALLILARRVIRSYFNGRRWLVPLPSHESVALSMMPRFTRLMNLLRDPNLVHPLTPVVIALTTKRLRGHREADYRYAFRRGSGFNRRTRRNAKYVGRPMLTKYPSLNVYSDVEWAPGYVTRKQRLAARRTLKALTA